MTIRVRGRSDTRLAIDGGRPARTRREPAMFPGALEIGEAEIEAVRSALTADAFEAYDRTLAYPSVGAFERAFAERMGSRHALGISSGTMALAVALAALGIGPGDEVIVPAYTFVATPSAVLAVGGIPILAEVDDSLTLDPESVASAITAATRAIVPVHMRGMPADMTTLLDIAHRHGLPIVEDAAQACGGSFRDEPLGSLGELGCFSLQSRKIITVGEGGMVVTDDEELLHRARCFHDAASAWRRTRRSQTADDSSGSDDFPGLNLRMSSIAGAIGQVQLRRLDGLLDRMRESKRRLAAVITELDSVELQRATDPGDAGIALIFFARTSAQAQAMSRALVAEGVRAKALYEPGQSDWHVYVCWHDLLAQRTWNRQGFPFSSARRPIRYDAKSCPATLDRLSRAVHIDVSPQLRDDDVQEIGSALRKVVMALG